jgi:phage-related protein
MKIVVWMGSSRDDLVAFPPDARREAGYQLERVQRAGEPCDWKPMSSIGPGVREIRIRDESNAFRVVYLSTRPEGIYVLHCFQKKTRKTAKRDLKWREAGSGRYRMLWSDDEEEGSIETQRPRSAAGYAAGPQRVSGFVSEG